MSSPFLLPRSITPFVAPPGFPADVAPNQIIFASHINAIRDSVALWPGDVNGNAKNLTGVALMSASVVAANMSPAPPAATSRLWATGDQTLVGANRALMFNLYYDTAWRAASAGYGYAITHTTTGKLDFLVAGSAAAGAINTPTAILSVYASGITVNGYVGVGGVNPFHNLSVAGASLNYDAPNIGNAIFSVGRGVAQTDLAILMGVSDSNYGWIQMAQPATGTFPLLLNGAGGGLILNAPNSAGPADAYLPINTFTMWANAGASALIIRLRAADGTMRQGSIALA